MTRTTIMTLLERLKGARSWWPSGRDRTPTMLALAFGLTAFFGVLYRYHFATDITDETFSIAMPYRFALGDKPFVDEIGIQQTAGIILFPFVWLYVKVTRGTTGIVLFVRYVHLFVFKVAAAGGVYSAARRLLQTRAIALGVAFVPFAFTPHNIPNVGYNVVGMTLLAAGIFFAAAGLLEPGTKRADRLLGGGGFLMGLMAFAYPPLVFPALVASVLVPFCAESRRVRSTLVFAGGGLAAGLVLAPSMAFGGVAGIKRTLGLGNQAADMSQHASATAKAMVDAFQVNLPRVSAYLVLAIFVAWLSRSRSLRVFVALVIVPALVLSYRDDSGHVVGTHRIVTYLGAIAPFVVLLARPDRHLLRAASFVVIPTYVAALCCAVASTQKLDAAALGFYTGMGLLAILLGRTIERAGASASLALIPAALIMAPLVTRGYDWVYRDAPFAQLTTKVTVGPWKGLYTTPDRKEMFDELSDITRRFDQKGGRMTILYEGPGLYLASRMPPGGHSVWEESYGDLEHWLVYWRSKNTGLGIVVKRRGMPNTAVDPIMAPPERKIFETRHFVVYREG